MEEKYRKILFAEEAFAREVALGVHITRPLTVWHYLIPGMFIIDFLRRMSAVRRYSYHFLFPRKLALDIARAALRGGERRSDLSRAREETGKWLDSLGLYSDGLNDRQVEVVEILVEHYQRLLSAEGNNYLSLNEYAYGNRGAYEAFLAHLASAEAEVDREILETQGQDKGLLERLTAEKAQVKKQRKKHTDKIFSWIG